MKIAVANHPHKQDRLYKQKSSGYWYCKATVKWSHFNTMQLLLQFDSLARQYTALRELLFSGSGGVTFRILCSLL